jgi:lambda family phage portal protein
MGIIHRLVSPPAAVPARAQRTFTAASVNRLTFSLGQSSQSVNADLDNALVILRSRARHLCANNEYGRRFLSLVANNVVGPRGPTLQVRRLDMKGNLDKPINDAVETHWSRWSKRCDVTGKLSLSNLLRIAIKAAARDGESLVRVVRGKDYPYGFALQLLEADRLNEAINRYTETGSVVRMGVELNGYQKPLAYHLFTRHPGENYANQPRQTERVPATDLRHVFLPERAEQVRGYTWLHAVLKRANMIDGYEEAAIVAARVGASKMGVFTRKDPDAPAPSMEGLADGKDANTGALQMSAEAGEFVDLTGMPGVDLSSWDPDYPHENFESFLKQCMRGFAAGLDVAAHNLSGNMTDVNYSSARIAELAERDIWVTLQDWLINTVLEPIYQEWLNVALLRGSITFNSGKSVPERLYSDIVNATRFQGRRWAWVDPLKDAQASREMIDAGLTSRTEIAASQGREFEDIVEELGQEKTLLQQAGIDTNAKPKPKEPPPNDKDESDET